MKLIFLKKRGKKKKKKKILKRNASFLDKLSFLLNENEK